MSDVLTRMHKNMCALLNLFSLGLASLALMAMPVAFARGPDEARGAGGAGGAGDTGGKSEYELDVEGMIAVRFYATVQPLASGLRSTFGSIDNNIRGLERYIPEAAKYGGGYSNWYPLRLDSDDLRPIRIPNFFDKDDAAALRAAHGRFVTDYTELFTLCNSLSDYLKDGAVSKEENFKRYTDARPRILELMEKVRAGAYELDSRALKLASAGEARTLPKNPCGFHIINMRAFIDVANQLMPLVSNPALRERDRYEDERNKRPPETEDEEAARMALAADTAGKIDAVIARLAALAETHKAAGAPAIAYENKSATETGLRCLENIYGYHCDGLKKEAGRIAESLRTKGTLRDHDNIERNLAYLYSEHNRFVEMFNLWAGGTQAMKLVEN